MDVAEFEALASIHEIYFDRIESETRFTAALICQMHRDWLGSLYSWAGSYRTVELAKGNFKWPPAYLVEQNMRALEWNTLNHLTPCRPGATGQVLQAMAVVHAELLLIHPFREGNGRLARWLADLMAAQAGLPLPGYRFSGRGALRERQMYLKAVQLGYGGDYQALADFFACALERGRLT